VLRQAEQESSIEVVEGCRHGSAVYHSRPITTDRTMWWPWVPLLQCPLPRAV